MIVVPPDVRTHCFSFLLYSLAFEEAIMATPVIRIISLYLSDQVDLLIVILG